MMSMIKFNIVFKWLLLLIACTFILVDIELVVDNLNQRRIWTHIELPH